jgi:4-amino-4-deoxy-L-arabinose transferase-like glycosyltransferase
MSAGVPEALRDLSPHQRTTLAWVAVLIVGGWLAFGGLGGRDVMRKAESRCAQTAQEMLASGDWVLPTFGGEPRLEKPPLMYWLIVAVSEPAGHVTEKTAMIPVVLSGLGVVLIVMAWGVWLGGLRTGVFAAVALATMPGVFVKGHHIEVEMTLTVFVTLAMWLLARRWMGWSRSPSEMALAIVALALAFLTKGPPTLVFPIATFAILAAWGWRHTEYRARASVGIWLILGVVIALLAIAPWALAILSRHPGAATQWWEEILSKRVGSEDASHSAGLLYYFLRLWPLMLPWLLFAPLAWWTADTPENRRQRALLLSWSLGCLVVFSLFGGKRWYYLLPVFPPVALLAGAGLDAWTRGLAGRAHRWGAGVLWALAGAGAAMPVAFPVTAAVLHVPWIWPLLWGVVTGALGVAALLCLRDRRRVVAVCAVLAAAVTLWTAYRLTFWPWENRTDSQRVIGTWVRGVVPADAPLYLYKTHVTEMRFYLDRPVTDLGEHSELLDLALLASAENRGLYVLVQRKHRDDLDPFIYEPVAEEVAGRPWTDYDDLLVRVTGVKASEE